MAWISFLVFLGVVLQPNHTCFEIETNNSGSNVPLSVSNFRCSCHSYITFLKHLEPKDFRSRFLLMWGWFWWFFWIREKMPVGILKVKALQITFFFLIIYETWGFPCTLQLCSFKCLVEFHTLLELTKLHKEVDQLCEMSAGWLPLQKCSSTCCLKLWHAAFSKSHPAWLAQP